MVCIGYALPGLCTLIDIPRYLLWWLFSPVCLIPVARNPPPLGERYYATTTLPSPTYIYLTRCYTAYYYPTGWRLPTGRCCIYHTITTRLCGLITLPLPTGDVAPRVLDLPARYDPHTRVRSGSQVTHTVTHAGGPTLRSDVIDVAV